jgi:hypothetical protein
MEAESDEADQQVILEEEIDENYEPTDKGTHCCCTLQT